MSVIQGQTKRRLNDATPEEWDEANRNLRKQLDEQCNGISARDYTTITIKTDIIDYKYNEDELIAEFKRYVDSTYGEHYSRDRFQATEFIIDGGHGTGFCIGNVLKYAQRYGKKGTPKDARKDLMKVLHYALIQLYIHDTENQ